MRTGMSADCFWPSDRWGGEPTPQEPTPASTISALISLARRLSVHQSNTFRTACGTCEFRLSSRGKSQERNSVRPENPHVRCFVEPL